MPRIGNTTSNAAPDVIGPRLIMLLCVLGLTLLGFVMIYSASSISAMSEDISTASYLIDQLGFAVVGVIAMFVLWKVVPYRFWEGPAIWVIWGVAVALLLLTAIMGLSALGAQRWLWLGPISLQPSEFVKIAIVLMAAKLFSEFRMGLTDPRTFIVQMIIFIVAPTGFLFATQSDLGTTAIIALGVLGVMWLGEVPLRTILIVIGCLVVFALGATVFSSYRGDRFLYLNPWNDGENGYGRGYQIIHSYYAFAEGGIFGTGLGNSREKYLYLPESETDFIYAIIGEELGLIGAVAVIVVWLILLWAGMRIARAATDDFGAMISGALTIMLVFQAFLNIGCVIGVFPTTGKPLPFISSGGSSLIASFMMIGLILSVSEDTGGRSVYEGRRDDLRVVRGGRSERARSRG
ncbi:MAG: cell division protein FtsW [Eggerthellaceae bacterium]|nr:cell division protein FtsW [Eggerthellaceae bacterium]